LKKRSLRKQELSLQKLKNGKAKRARRPQEMHKLRSGKAKGARRP